MSLTKATPGMYLKPIRKEHVDALMALEVKCHKRYDEDFEVETTPAWAWTRKDLMSAVKQKENKRLGQYPTTCYVVERNKEVVGGIVYEKVPEPRLINVLWCVVDPDAPTSVFMKMFDWLVELADRSKNSSMVVYDIPDGWYRAVEYLQGQPDWEIRRIGDCFPGPDRDVRTDAWRLTYQSLGKDDLRGGLQGSAY